MRTIAQARMLASGVKGEIGPDGSECPACCARNERRAALAEALAAALTDDVLHQLALALVPHLRSAASNDPLALTCDEPLPVASTRVRKAGTRKRGPRPVKVPAIEVSEVSAARAARSLRKMGYPVR
jgi:hypothetical protein